MTYVSGGVGQRRLGMGMEWLPWCKQSLPFGTTERASGLPAPLPTLKPLLGEYFRVAFMSLGI